MRATADVEKALENDYVSGALWDVCFYIAPKKKRV